MVRGNTVVHTHDCIMLTNEAGDETIYREHVEHTVDVDVIDLPSKMSSSGVRFEK